jgi:hypothetical protein
MTEYTYEPYRPETYGGKMFTITPAEGEPFLVSTATGEDQIPELVEHRLNPPPQQPYPPPGPPVPTQEQAIAFDHENRLRSLEGQPPLTVEDFAKRVATLTVK